MVHTSVPLHIPHERALLLSPSNGSTDYGVCCRVGIEIGCVNLERERRGADMTQYQRVE
jgi:hypothetical protein